VELVMRSFPNEPNGEELAELLLSRFRTGELNLVVVCDRVPPGLPELIAGIAAQKTLGFNLDLVEIAPFIMDGSDDSAILFVPTTRLVTEIVARTAVTITYQQGDPQPETTVQTTTLEEIEDRVLSAKKIKDSGPVWTSAQIEEEARRLDEPIGVALIEFCKRHSDRGQFFADRPTNANFGLYLRGRRDDGTECRRCVFSCRLASKDIYLYMNFVTELVGREIAEQSKHRFKQVFGEAFNAEAKETPIPLTAVAERWPAFQDALLWLKSKADSRAT
jgi:hypothetical protein